MSFNFSMNCLTSSWCTLRAGNHPFKLKTHSGHGRRRWIKYSILYGNCFEFNVGAIFRIFRTIPGWSWVMCTRRQPRTSGSLWSLSTWASDRGAYPCFWTSANSLWNRWWIWLISGRTSKIMCSGGATASGEISQFDNQCCIFLFNRLENLGEATVQLRERNWRIFSLSGKTRPWILKCDDYGRNEMLTA